MALKIEIVDFPKTDYISVRHLGSYSGCKPAWDKLMSWAAAKNFINKLMFWKKSEPILTKQTAYFGLCYDDPDKVKDCRYDACFSITEETKQALQNKLPGGIQIGIIPKGKYAIALVKGPYEQFYYVYTEFFNGQTLKFDEIDFSKPTIEKYINSPKNTKPEDLLTEFYIPLK